MARKKKVRRVGQWYNTIRTINGEKRRVRVKKNSDGTEKVEVLFPRDKQIKMSNKAKSLKGISRASHLNAKRSSTAITRDKRANARNTLTPTKKNIETWRKNPRRVDIEGIDTKN